MVILTTTSILWGSGQNRACFSAFSAFSPFLTPSFPCIVLRMSTRCFAGGSCEARRQSVAMQIHGHEPWASCILYQSYGQSIEARTGMILTSSSALLRCHIPRSESRVMQVWASDTLQKNSEDAGYPKSAGLLSAPRTGGVASHGRPASQRIWGRLHGIPDTAFPRQYAEF